MYDIIISTNKNLEEPHTVEKLLKNGIFKSFLSTIFFGAFYALISFIMDGFVEVDKVLRTMVLYFIITCVFYSIAPKLRKMTGNNKDNNC